MDSKGFICNHHVIHPAICFLKALSNSSLSIFLSKERSMKDSPSGGRSLCVLLILRSGFIREEFRRRDWVDCSIHFLGGDKDLSCVDFLYWESLLSLSLKIQAMLESIFVFGWTSSGMISDWRMKLNLVGFSLLCWIYKASFLWVEFMLSFQSLKVTTDLMKS